jgi:hypothetical protein
MDTICRTVWRACRQPKAICAVAGGQGIRIEADEQRTWGSRPPATTRQDQRLQQHDACDTKTGYVQKSSEYRITGESRHKRHAVREGGTWRDLQAIPILSFTMALGAENEISCIRVDIEPSFLTRTHSGPHDCNRLHSSGHGFGTGCVWCPGPGGESSFASAMGCTGLPNEYAAMTGSRLTTSAATTNDQHGI